MKKIGKDKQKDKQFVDNKIATAWKGHNNYYSMDPYEGGGG